MYQVNLELKPDTDKVVTPPVDDVTKYGPVDGDPVVDKEEIPYETKREFDPNLKAGRKSCPKGENGEKQSQHQQRKIH